MALERGDLCSFAQGIADWSTVELEMLDPEQCIKFVLGGREGEFQFRTLPSSLTHPLKFVVGGDVYFYLSKMRKMNRQTAGWAPDFIVVGGDIAYTYGGRALFTGSGGRSSGGAPF